MSPVIQFKLCLGCHGKKAGEMMDNKTVDLKKRKFVQRASYVAPVILTLTAIPSFASSGSGWNRPRRGNEGVGNGEDPPPPGHSTNYNDYPGTGPGNPGSKQNRNHSRFRG